MTRKLKRTQAFDLSLEVKDDAFLRPPHEFQRNWLLNRFLREAADDLQALDGVAHRFVPGGTRELPEDLRSAVLSDEQIMEEWQLPLMKAMAAIASRSGGDVLEIGFGLGISASLMQGHGVRSHTIVECNPSVIERYERWVTAYPERDIRMVPGLWQDAIGDLGQFDAIFFHTYALDEDESVELLARSVTFAAHFFPAAAEHLRPRGVFTYLTGEIDSLSRAHQRLLLEHFSCFTVQRIALHVPAEVRDAWWADSMVVVEAVK